MACYEDTESMIELCKRSYDCPHHKYKFNMDGNNKTGCARVLLGTLRSDNGDGDVGLFYFRLRTAHE